ncbi:hypothetical protein NIES2135_00500 [Leptolyngbya boryana NIES-2135]|jgi:hypothetical protein|uniref:Uncharacterized protein n=1 Tax=Leptolyngbya boryana NIES-2135 TaxID=1973484 RepID=A0A1Z4J9A4_LEPBY|nr:MULTISPECIES: hypothetical protein [Leptolyngbya]BAY53248.1 hypothetical protein NIES2135_00500 [Leptolyngbya boryana NIES-2135]MBD2366880.1 hypothetical protein [Leptolyngbya sp. FACHB-161]MBD2373106.1 hypothetical protein [Leptolyngbya sp. FACHB-238]MBD2397507.1 hypothetical protein [Leptolyngbya sp. FACHB-239]MBD2404651.1 hypothetical protein [Leptolyngbya sp. FACHB-402]
MNGFRIILVALVLLLNLVGASPAWADPPKLTGTPEYAEVTQAIANLIQAKASPEESDLTPVEIEQKLGALNLQKYILETASHYSQCRNSTGSTIAVFAHKAKKAPQSPSVLYYLANGEITEDEWSCDGVYLPTGTKLAGLSEVTEPTVAQFVSGTRLNATVNAQGELEFNLAPSKFAKSSDGVLPIPDLTVATIQASLPNAPIED